MSLGHILPLLDYIKLRRCGIIVNETTIHQTSMKWMQAIYRQPYEKTRRFFSMIILTVVIAISYGYEVGKRTH